MHDKSATIGCKLVVGCSLPTSGAAGGEFLLGSTASLNFMEDDMTTPATATVLGGFWPANGVGSLSSYSGKGEERRIVSQQLNHRGQLPNRALFAALLGVAPGATATKTLTRIANSTELGGVRAIESVNLINRVTTAADVTELTADYLTLSSRTTFGANPPANLDRNPLGTR